MASKKKADHGAPTGARKGGGAAGGAPRRGKGKAVPAAHPAPEAAVAPTGRVVVEREIGGRTLTIETGRMAKLSDGAAVVRYGDTMVLAAVNSSKAPDNMDFFPLTVDYREKTSAAGVIPGGFFKREGRPTTKEILASRLIDRSIRPMFPDGFRRDVQVLSQVLSTDRENDPDVVAAIASFAALALSSLPHGRSLGMVRIGLVDGELVVNPLWTDLQGERNALNLTVASHADAIVMVEAGAREVEEATMLEALELAHGVCRQIVAMIDELAAKAGKPKMAFEPPAPDAELAAAIEQQFGAALRAAPVTPGPKQVRNAAVKAAKEAVIAGFPAPSAADESARRAWEKKVAELAGEIVKQAERDSILAGKRADGRDLTTVRPIAIEVGVLPRVHGSVLFTRGETQALGVVTLGGTDDQQIIDGLMPEPRKRFLLHYSFPPFSVGETKRMLAPGRREIGHGALAERGLEPVLPSREEFPYTIRITSEILESNGSSSMATACAGTLAMMDAGVPIKQPVAGIAMGLVMAGKRYSILTDILGSEDACGDMDFKVVGTGRGITALQMDIKCDGLTRAIMAEALEQARQGRLHVLREMLKTLRSPRASLSPNAPRLESVQVPSDKIGLIIGPGGKNIRQLQEQFECKISIEDSGLCTITGVNAEKVEGCLRHIKAMTAEIELGAIYEGRVTAIKEFGAFVEILPGQEGLVHVSELSAEFIRAVTDVVRIGDTIKVKVIAIDDFGKVKLSRKALLVDVRGPAETGVGAEREARREPDGLQDRDRERRLRGGERGDRPRRERGDDSGDDRGRRGTGEHRPALALREPREHDEPGERRDYGGRRDREEFHGRRDRDDWRGEAPRRDRGEPGDRPQRGGSSRGEAFDDRPRRDRPHREVASFDERGSRPERSDRGDRLERGDRMERGDYLDRGGREGRGDRLSRPERGVRGDEFGGRPHAGRDRHQPLHTEARGGSRDRPPDSEPVADDPVDRPTREPRGGRGERRDREDRGDRGTRGVGRDSARRAELPMAEFDDDVPPASDQQEVGELESLDSVLGGQPRRRSDRPRGRGRRRDR